MCRISLQLFGFPICVASRNQVRNLTLATLSRPDVFTQLKIVWIKCSNLVAVCCNKSVPYANSLQDFRGDTSTRTPVLFNVSFELKCRILFRFFFNKNSVAGHLLTSLCTFDEVGTETPKPRHVNLLLYFCRFSS